ncbi:MAG: DUF3540 domain-containing protein [Deltaproteobacteria bacterium]|nr:DUF3540 domain-containing protein [Deltaproteobacteria bacterium]
MARGGKRAVPKEPPGAGARKGLHAGIFPAVVLVGATPDGLVRVRLLGDGPGGSGTELLVRQAPDGAQPRQPGDRVLVVSDGAGARLGGLLAPAAPPAIELPDGAVARLEQGALELRDPQGRLLLRYRAGEAELCAPQGDFTLAAPQGRVVLRAASDIELDAPRDLRQHAGERIELRLGREQEPSVQLDRERAELRSPEVAVRAGRARVDATEATVAARTIHTVAERLAQRVQRYELSAGRLLEHSREAFYEVADLLQIRAGRMRTLVERLFELRSRRTAMVSEQETRVDGKKVLLG